MGGMYLNCKIMDSIYMCIVVIFDIIDIRVKGHQLMDTGKLESIVFGKNQRAGNEFASSSGLSVRNYRADTTNRVIQLLLVASPEAVVGL